MGSHDAPVEEDESNRDVPVQLSNDSLDAPDETKTEKLSTKKKKAKKSKEKEQRVPSFTAIAPDGTTHTFQIDPKDTGRDIRKKVAKKTGVALKDLSLSKDGNDLDKKFVPSAGDELTIQPPKIRISLPDGKKVSFPVYPTTTIDDVKSFLEKETGSPPDDQDLFFYGVNGKELISSLPDMQSDYDLKLKINARTEPTIITVNTPEEESFSVEILPSDTAKDVRKKIAKKAGVPVKSLRLTMGDIEVDQKYLPVHGDVLTVAAPIVTLVFPDGETMELEAMPGTTVDDIKDILEEEMGIAKACQKFTSTGKNTRVWLDSEVIDNDITFQFEELEYDEEYEEITIEELMSDSSDEEETVVSLEGGSPIRSSRTKANVDVSPKKKKEDPKAKEIIVHDPKAGCKHRFTFDPKLTIEEIKHKIPPHGRVSHVFEDLCITCNGEELMNDKTLEEYGLTSGDTVILEKYFINIMHFLSAILPFEDVTSLETIGSIKTKLASQQSIPKDKQLLTIHGTNKRLDDNYKTLHEYGIRHRTVLVLQEDNEEVVEEVKKANVELSLNDSQNLDDRLAKIKERAEARKRAKLAAGKKK